MVHYSQELSASIPTLEAGVSLLVGYPQLFILYIHHCIPYFEAVYSIRNLMT
jgi:hypothetical protein